MNAGIGHNNDYNLTLGQSTTISDADIVVIRTLQVGNEDWLQGVDYFWDSFSIEVDVFVGFLVAETAVAAAAEGKGLSVVVEEIRVDASGRDFGDFVVDCFHLAGLGLVGCVFVGPLASVAEFSLISRSPGVNLPGFCDSHAVGVLFSSGAGHLDHFHIC